MSEVSSPTPLYHRIYSVLRERVVNGYYPAGIAMPSEAELATSFNVSRITIRKAMEMLTAESLVTRTRGRGHSCPNKQATTISTGPWLRMFRAC
jgi:GntR family transcriptional regulator